MGIAGGVLLLIIGAVLAFAVRIDTGAVDIQIVGWIVLLGGLFSVGLSLWRMTATRRRTVQVHHNPGDDWQTEIEEDHLVRNEDEPPPP
jgi:hypothetical protein